MQIYARKNVDGEFKDVRVDDSDTLYLMFHLSNGQEFKVYPTHNNDKLDIMAVNDRLMVEPKASNVIQVSEVR